MTHTTASHTQISIPLLNLHFISFFFFFNDTATTEIYTLSLHDALPISTRARHCGKRDRTAGRGRPALCNGKRSEEHTSELQSHVNLVCRLLLEKKKKNKKLLTQHKKSEYAVQLRP